MYITDNKSIYPNGADKNIKIHSFNKKLCGKLRPGHFKAVVDVINRFIHIIKPNKIYLGEKDFQQFLIIKDYVNKKYKNISIVKCKTVREKNGLAYSSRNYLLTKNEKITAGKIYKIISRNKKKIIKKILNLKKLKKEIYKLGVSKIDYVKIININKVVKQISKKNKYKIFFAYYLRDVRLIDNV